MNHRVIAFYLPQFHPIPENDAWWGKGFTEWRNVVKAVPLFKGHYQPHLPADLGFYDLRVSEVQEAQADLAAEYGIYGFCYYHYWFNGKRLLERPFEQMLASGRPDFPFCLCWANENWTRRWNGAEQEVLIRQEYSNADDRAHIRELVRAFEDERYIRVCGKPLFLVYHASELPNPARTVEIWRAEASAMGVGDLYLCNVESNANEYGKGVQWGFDASVEFSPDWRILRYAIPRDWRWKIEYMMKRKELKHHRIFEYSLFVEQMIAKEKPNYLRYPCVTPSWDNLARRTVGATIIKGSSPQIYEQWLTKVISQFNAPTAEENFVFINAWNEWAEGNHLEPCQRWGHSYLEATRRAIRAEMVEPMQHNADILY